MNILLPKYADFYENRHKIRKKSVYHRKYHIMNVMNDIAQKNNIQIRYYNGENILRILNWLTEFHRKLILAGDAWLVLILFSSNHSTF